MAPGAPEAAGKLTWDNAALLSPRTAARFGVADEDVVELVYRGRVQRAPVLVIPGHADDSVTVHVGYGRRRAGTLGSNLGWNAYALRTSTAPWFDTGLELRVTGARHPLARTATHHRMHGRELVRTTTLEEYHRSPGHAVAKPHHGDGPPPSLYPEYRYPTYAWGMVVDLTTCTGCNACVVACYAENNIPVVGKDQVRMGREMAWLRVDTYFRGSETDPEVQLEPRLVRLLECADGAPRPRRSYRAPRDRTRRARWRRGRCGARVRAS